MATDQDINNLAWTLLGEAANQGQSGMQAVGNVVLNRLASGRYGSTITQVVRAPQQFSAWNSGAGGNNPSGRWPQSSTAFQNAKVIAQQLVAGQLPDNTGGAVMYWAPGMMQATTGHADPYWARSEETNGRLQIGDQVFLPKHPVPPANVPPPASTGTSTGLNAPTSAVGGAPAAPADISQLYGQHTVPVPLAPPPAVSNWADSYMNLPQVPGAPQPVAPAAPAAPIPMPASARPVPTVPAPPSAPPPQTVAIGNHVYQVGQTFTSGGNTYRVEANGTFSKGARDTFTPGTVAGGVLGKAVNSALSSAAAAAPSVLDNAKNAVGNLFGGLFGPHPVQAPPALVPGSNNAGWGDYLKPPSVPAPAPAPPASNNDGWSQYMAPSSPPPPVPSAPSPSSNNNGGWGSYFQPPSTSGIAGTVQLPAGVVPAGATAAMAQANGNSGSYANTDSWNSLTSSFARPPAAPAYSTPTPPAAPAPPTTKQIVNPAYTQWASLSGAADPYQNDAFAYAMSQEPAPPKMITVQVPRTVPVPKPLAPPVAAPPAPPTGLAGWYGSTPLGHITNFLGGLAGGAPAPNTGGLLSMLSNGFGGFGSTPNPTSIVGPPIGAPNGYVYGQNSGGGFSKIGVAPQYANMTPAQQYASLTGQNYTNPASINNSDNNRSLTEGGFNG